MVSHSAVTREDSCPQCSREGSTLSTTGNSRRRRRERRRHQGSTRHRSRNRNRRRSTNRETNTTNTDEPVETAITFTPEEEAKRCQVGQWPHGLSFLFATLSCTIGVFNICRFAILTADFGPVFLVQFLALSIFFGIPLMTFHVSLGQYLGSGVVDMWRISPLFQGIGVALMLSQGMLGSNGIACISWLFIYLRDSFITTFDRYRWSYCHHDSAYGRTCQADYYNNTLRIEQSLADYFAGTVLQRSSPNYPNATVGHLKFQTVFNMLVIWMVIFMGLSKGLKSYGKVVYIFGILPVLGFLVFATKALSMLPYVAYSYNFVFTHWADFLYNKKSWICAARECFFTWSLLGASLLQLGSHNKFKHRLIRDTTIVSIITIFILVVSGLTGFATVQNIYHFGYDYGGSSFETSKSYEFLKGHSIRSLSAIKRMVPRDKQHISFISGIRIIEPGRDTDLYSGYQTMRLATEIIPAFASILGPRYFSPFWIVLFYFSLIMFGLGQQMALWHTVISGLIAIKPESLKSLQTCITFSCCIVGFILGLPMATEIGLFVLYFLDYTIGCAWWLMLLYVAQIFIVFVVRGAPYTSDEVVTALLGKSNRCGIAWLLAFVWAVALPLVLIVLVVLSFQTGRLTEMFDWTVGSGYLYLPSWVREIGTMMQLMPLLLIPFVAVIQSCRYFLHGPEDLLDRIDLLYRPSYANSRNYSRRMNQRPEVMLVNYNSNSSPNHNDDPPPKYTPPPSYSAATGARIARFLRQSFRQSIRRLRGTGQLSLDKEDDQSPPPPDYATVIIETTRQSRSLEDPSLPCSFISEGDGAHHSRQDSSTNTVLTASELNRMFQDGSSQGQSLENSNELFNLQRVDSEAVLVQSAEPIDMSHPKCDDASSIDESTGTYSPLTQSSEESVLSLDEVKTEDTLETNEAINLNISHNQLPSETVFLQIDTLETNEAINLNISHNQLPSETVFLQIDTSSSVI